MPEGLADPGRRWERLRLELESLPQDPVSRTHPRNWLFRVKRGLDFIGHARMDWSRFFAKVDPYPKPFEHVAFDAADGVRIAGWFGPQSRPKGSEAEWGVVLVPGMFSSKDDTAHKRRAIRMWREWKVPMLVIDLRGFGESTGIPTAGWKEAQDVVAAAQELVRRAGVKRVAVFAESLGGAAALNALAHDGEAGLHLLTGGMLCFSPFVDAADAVAYISARPPEEDRFFVQWRGFRRLLRLKSMGAYERFDDYLADTARVYGLEGLDELCDLANPKWKVPMMRQPALLVHATDDPVVPVRHARRMERYAVDLPHIQTIVTTWGGHTGFEPMDPWWFWEVCRRFYAEVNGEQLANLAGDKLLEP